MEAWLLDIPIAVWIGGGLALYMAWAIGANDVANAMGTGVGSGALSIGRAVIVALDQCFTCLTCRTYWRSSSSKMSAGDVWRI